MKPKMPKNSSIRPGFDVTDATTAEKLERTSHAPLRWMPISFLFLLHPFPVSRYYFHPYFTHFLSYFSFLLPLNLARGSGKHCKLPTVPSENASRKSWRGPNTFGPRNLQSWKGRVPRVQWGGCVPR